MTSMRLPASTSLTSWIERSWPIASGVSVSGRGTVSRSGRTGSVAGSSRWPPTCDVAPVVAGVDVDHEAPSSSRAISPSASSRATSIGTVARLGPLQRQLDPQDPVAVGRRGGLGDDVGAERDPAPERAEVDLELLVDAALGVGGAAVAGEDELAALDVEGDLVGVDARQLGHARPRAAGRPRRRRRPRARSRPGRGARGRRRRRRRRTARPSAAASARSSRRGRAPGAWAQSRSVRCGRAQDRALDPGAVARPSGDVEVGARRRRPRGRPRPRP